MISSRSSCFLFNYNATTDIYTYSHTLSLHAALPSYRASGDKPGGAYGRFDTLFGMRRAELAPAGLYNAISRSNLTTQGIRFEAAPSKRLEDQKSTRLNSSH